MEFLIGGSYIADPVWSLERLRGTQSSISLPLSLWKKEEKKKQKQQLFHWPHCHPAEKCVISACLQVWHTCSSSRLKCLPSRRQPLSLAVTEARTPEEKRKKKKKKERERATVCHSSNKSPPWLNAAPHRRNGHLHGCTIESTLLTQWSHYISDAYLLPRAGLLAAGSYCWDIMAPGHFWNSIIIQLIKAAPAP